MVLSNTFLKSFKILSDYEETNYTDLVYAVRKSISSGFPVTPLIYLNLVILSYSIMGIPFYFIITI